MIAAAQRLAATIPHRYFRHVALVMRGGAVLAVGTNTSRHAEVAALSKLFPSLRAGTRVVSLRIAKHGRLAMGRPCPDCMEFLRANRVKAVTYSDSRGNLVTERIR